MTETPLAIARNIVNQMFDVTGADVATRQSLNDSADAFVLAMVREAQAQALEAAALDWDAEYERITSVSGAYNATKVRAALVTASGMARQSAARIREANPSDSAPIKPSGGA